MISKVGLAAVSMYLAAEGFSLLTAPKSLVRVAVAKVTSQGQLYCSEPPQNAELPPAGWLASQMETPYKLPHGA